MKATFPTTIINEDFIMKPIIAMAIACALCVCAPARADDALPAGAVKKGTLANAKLLQDAKVGVASKVGTMGCMKLGDVDTYVLAMPAGTAGSRQWKERWIVSGCGSHYPVDIEFTEDGHGGAYWTIH